MKCPFCGATIQLADTQCTHCRAAIDYLQDHIFVGRQFAFFDAQPNQPITVDLIAHDAAQPVEQRFDAPTIIARHDYAIRLGALGPKHKKKLWDRTRREEMDYQISSELPALTFSRLDLLTVVTDRRIYRPEDRVHIIAVAPGCAGQPAELEVKLSGQRVYLTSVTLDAAGLHMHDYTGLDEGEYQVLLRLPGRPGAQADCTFSCAEFTLSPLTAILEAHQIDRFLLHLQIHVKQLAVPYAGLIDVRLLSGSQAVDHQRVIVEQGQLIVDFRFDRPWWETLETLRVELITPEGNTATIALPGTSAEEREHIPLSPLDMPVEASLAPFSGQTGTVRGLHYGPRESKDTLFALPAVVAREGRLRAQRAALQVRLLVFNPLDGGRQTLDFHDVQAGDELTFAVDAPYAIFTLGAFTGLREPYEAWGVVVSPVTLTARLDAPPTALPGQLMEVDVETGRPARCLLLVYDARLEHESPLPKLARCLFEHVRDNTSQLQVARLDPLSTATYDQAELWDNMLMFGLPRGAPVGAKGMFRSVEALSIESLPVEAALAPPEMVAALMLAPRESFPELAFLELFPVDGTARRTIKLGDQIGTWRCRVYLFDGLDYVELTHDVQVDAELYAELDLPAILGEGDVVTATSRYHTQAPARLTITTPAEEFTYGVLGDGVVEFPLTVPGQVRTTIQAGETSDVSQRTVEPPGVETVTASRWVLLSPGETISGRRVVVFPNAMPALQSAIDYLIDYPFG